MALRSTEGIPKPTREPNIRGHNVSPGLIDMSLGGILGQKVRGRLLATGMRDVSLTLSRSGGT
jgi:N-acetylglucosamine-6-phosphate deacetylase